MSNTERGWWLQMIFFLVLICGLLICIWFQGRRIMIQREKIKELEKWHNIALTDTLTQIPNRVAYSQMVEKLRESGRPQEGDRNTIILFDVDDFKIINDSNGHMEGDRILQNCAKMLRLVFNHPGCNVYRIGGDEFAMIARNVTDAYIRVCIKKIHQYERNGLGCRLSMGCATSDEAVEFSGMFRLADKKLYKEKGRKKQSRQ